jgi:RNA polymerase sigma-70 factor (ECF subfamily)
MAAHAPSLPAWLIGACPRASMRILRPVLEGGTARDEVLLARLKAGDERALGIVYDLHAPMVFGVARRVTGDDQAARDVTQEVFTYLWELPGRVDLERGTIRAYLGVVAHRRAVDEVRRVVRRGSAETRASGTHDGTEAGHEAEVVEAEHHGWWQRRVRALLDELPAEQQTALRLAYFDGCSYREVARTLGIPEGTAKSRLRLALARLRTLLDVEGGEAWA